MNMSNEKDLIKFIHNTNVPEIVNSKCREAYDMIYKECEQKKENIKETALEQSINEENKTFHGDKPAEKKWKYSPGKCLAAIVCAAAVSACFAIPAISLYIPSLKNNLEYASHETLEKDATGENEPIKYAAPISKEIEEKPVDIELHNVFCDESNLAISFVIKPNDYEQLKDTTHLTVSYTLTIDDEIIPDKYKYEPITELGQSSDKNYYGVIRYESLNSNKNLNIKDGSQLSLKINELRGTNIYKQHGNLNSMHQIEYEPEETVMLDDVCELSYTLNMDTSHNTIYDVYETQGDITLENIEVSPFKTIIHISGLTDNNYIVMYDQNGDKIELRSIDPEFYTFQFESPYISSDLLSICIYYYEYDAEALSNDLPAEYEFEVPINEGFVEKFESVWQFDQSEIIYDSPLEVMENSYDPNDKILFDTFKESVKPEPVGTNIPLFESAFQHNMSVKDCQIIDYDKFPYDLEIGAAETYEKYIGSIDKAKILLITCTITNTMDISTKLVFNGPCIVSKDMYGDIPMAFNIFYYYNYIYAKDDYGNGVYDFEPNETKTIKFGYLMPEECADAGYWIYTLDDIYDSYGNVLTNLIDGKGKLYEIQ